VDLSGRVVIPGLIDSHAHLLNLGEFLEQVDLVGTRSYDEVLERVARRVASSDPGTWIFGRGWDQNDWEAREFPERPALDALSPRNPVVLTRVDGHAVLVNGPALAAAGIDRNTPEPEGGEILRDAAGEPTGILVDNATLLVENVAPAPGPEDLRRMLAAATRHCLALGLTGVHDAGLGYAADDEGARAGYPTWDVMREMADSGELGLRVYGMLGGQPLPPEAYLRRPPEIGRADGMLTVRTVKLYADGALGSRGAALLEDYTDRPGHRGLLLTDPARIEETVRQAVDAGYQVGVHAIGDRANRVVLDVYERVLAEHPGEDLRLRIEHAQVIAPADIPRFAALGVIPAMQPTHATSDMYWAEERLGRERLAGAYAWRSLLDAGVPHLPLGSDFPVESANPFWGWYAAVTRQDAEGQPPGGWLPGQRLGREEALRGFTLDAAYAAFQEDDLGSLSPGKLADFLVLDRDPLTVPAGELRDTRVLETWVGGRRAFPLP
jgi:predicted amidohydrolase YtcJ